MKTAEEYINEFVRMHALSIACRPELTEMIDGLREDDKKHWIDRCAEQCDRIYDATGDMDIRHGAMKSKQAILSLKPSIQTKE